MPLVRRTRATLRRAEFGFFGLVVNTRVQTPRRWGEPSSAGVLFFSTLSCRPLRTSCWIVGTTSPVSVCRWVQLTWNVTDPRGRVCRITRTPAARQKECADCGGRSTALSAVERHARRPGHTPGTRSERTYRIRCGQNKWVTPGPSSPAPGPSAARGGRHHERHHEQQHPAGRRQPAEHQSGDRETVALLTGAPDLRA